MQTHDAVLSDDVLRRCAERCAGYDRDNSFFHEDFAELKQAGYLTMAVPKELGGRGLTLAQCCQEQRRLAYHAPATALGINMHVYWVGLVADLWRQGDKSLEWLLKEVMAGEVFNAGHSERGNDIPAMLSTAKAERVEGGFRFTGHKMFGTLAPVFTRYGLHGLWADAEGGPKIVHAFMPRDTAGSCSVHGVSGPRYSGRNGNDSQRPDTANQLLVAEVMNTIGARHGDGNARRASTARCRPRPRS